MWPRRDLLDLLAIEVPIVQAPMAVSDTPALAAAVSNAGGLGSLGCGEMSPDDLRAGAAELRAATERPFNLNFFAHPAPKPDPETDARTRARLAPFYEEFAPGTVPPAAEAPFGVFDGDKLSALLDIRPAVVSFHFGLPEAEALRALEEADCRILC